MGCRRFPRDFFEDLPLICRHFIKNNEKKNKKEEAGNLCSYFTEYVDIVSITDGFFLYVGKHLNKWKGNMKMFWDFFKPGAFQCRSLKRFSITF